MTDANLIAGRINPDYFLGGELAVSVELASARDAADRRRASASRSRTPRSA